MRTLLPPSLRALSQTLLICLLAPAATALADDSPATATTKPAQADPNAFTKQAYGFVKATLLGSAEKMPEENYGFKPAEAVRSFGQIVGHVADSQYYFCSAVLGEKNPGLQIEKTKTSKADLVESLKGAFAYCDKAYNGMTVASGAETVKLFKGDMLKRDALAANSLHGVEHYGNHRLPAHEEHRSSEQRTGVHARAEERARAEGRV
jgi:uncharacterized damage-inducible protein DinB